MGPGLIQLKLLVIYGICCAKISTVQLLIVSIERTMFRYFIEVTLLKSRVYVFYWCLNVSQFNWSVTFIFLFKKSLTALNCYCHIWTNGIWRCLLLLGKTTSLPLNTAWDQCILILLKLLVIYGICFSVQTVGCQHWKNIFNVSLFNSCVYGFYWRLNVSQCTSLLATVQNCLPGFPRLLERPGIFFFKFPGPGKSWKITLVLESPGNCWRSSKVLEKYPWKLHIKAFL